MKALPNRRKRRFELYQHDRKDPWGEPKICTIQVFCVILHPIKTSRDEFLYY